MPKTDRGKFLKLSLPRRMMCSWLAVCHKIPLAHGERRVELKELVDLVRAAKRKIGWPTIFFKAYAIVSAGRPALRRHYVRYPRPRLYEHPETVGSMAISRRIDGDDGLLYLPISSPEKLPLEEIERRLNEARLAPEAQIPAFRRQLRLGRLPWPLLQLLTHVGMGWMGRQRCRLMGTFGMSCLASMGVANLVTYVPWTTMIHFTPFLPDGSCHVRLAMDHRVFDGLEAAQALWELEKALTGAILEEIRAMVPSAAPTSLRIAA